MFDRHRAWAWWETGMAIIHVIGGEMLLHTVIHTGISPTVGYLHCWIGVLYSKLALSPVRLCPSLTSCVPRLVALPLSSWHTQHPEDLVSTSSSLDLQESPRRVAKNTFKAEGKFAMFPFLSRPPCRVGEPKEGGEVRRWHLRCAQEMSITLL
jgi:hypothetical protein